MFFFLNYTILFCIVLRGYLPLADYIISLLIFANGSFYICFMDKLVFLNSKVVFFFTLVVVSSAIWGLVSNMIPHRRLLELPIFIFEHIYFVPLAYAFLRISLISKLSHFRKILCLALIFLNASAILQLLGFPVPIMQVVDIDSSLNTIYSSRLSGFMGTSTPFAYSLCFALLSQFYLGKMLPLNQSSMSNKFLGLLSILSLIFSFSRAPITYLLIMLLAYPVLRLMISGAYFKKSVYAISPGNLVVIISAFMFSVAGFSYMVPYLARISSVIDLADPGNIDRLSSMSYVLNECLQGYDGNMLLGSGMSSTSRHLQRHSGESQIVKFICEYGFAGFAVLLSAIYVYLLKVYKRIILSGIIIFLLSLPLFFLQILVSPAATFFYILMSSIFLKSIKYFQNSDLTKTL